MRLVDEAMETKPQHRRRSPRLVYSGTIAVLAIVLVLALSLPSTSGPIDMGTSTTAATTEVVAIRAKVNNKFVTAENAGNSPLIANRAAVGPWETFDLTRVNDTDVYLRAHANGKYVCAEAGGGAALISNRTAVGPWETFQLINNSDGSTSLRARANNRLVSAESAGGSSLIANRTTVGLWEKFDIIKLSTPTPTPTATPTTSPSSLDDWPNANNTGVPAGTTLAPYSGPCTITANNTVIDARTVNCTLTIRSANVRITRSVINGTVNIESASSGYSLNINDSEIRIGDNLNTGLMRANFRANRVEITGGRRSVYCENNCVIENSWVHGQGGDPNGQAHFSGIRMSQGTTIRHNTITCDGLRLPPASGCSAGLTGYGDFAPVQNNLIENNIFYGGTSTVCAYGGSSASKPYSSGARSIRFINNVFVRGSSGRCGNLGAIFSFDRSAPGNLWTGNKWDDGTPLIP